MSGHNSIDRFFFTISQIQLFILKESLFRSSVLCVFHPSAAWSVMVEDKWCRRALTHTHKHTQRRVHLIEELLAKSPCSRSESSITQDLRNVNLRLRLKWMKHSPSLHQASLLTPPGLQLRATDTLSTSYTLTNRAEMSRRHHYPCLVWAGIGVYDLRLARHEVSDLLRRCPMHYIFIVKTSCRDQLRKLNCTNAKYYALIND